MPSVKIQRGKYRGKKLATPPTSSGGSNATPSLFKEAVFQMLDNRVKSPENRAFFDLCAGSGQMGVEALSQGYHPVHLCELDRGRFSFLIENVKEFKKELVLHNKDFRRMAPVILGSSDSVVFLDPPYSFWKGARCPHIDRLLENLIKGKSDHQASREILILIQGPEPYEPAENTLFENRLRLENRKYRKQNLTVIEIVDVDVAPDRTIEPKDQI